MAYSSGDIIMLKPLVLPTEEEFAKQLDLAQKWAASVGYTEEDVNDIIKQKRKHKRSKFCQDISGEEATPARMRTL